MKNSVFYLITVLIWGSTWIGIKLQLGTIAPMVSVTYRFSLAAVVLLIWCLLKKLSMRYTIRQHGFMLLQGILLFSMNYLLFYVAELYIASGLAAVIFSTIVILNVFFSAIFLGTAINRNVLLGAFLGMTGIILVFRHEISGFSFENESLLGVALCLAATFLASLGNIVSARNQKNGLPIIQTNAYGMAYGALAMFLFCLITGQTFTFDASITYVSSLIYLAMFGSIIAFGCYLTLVGNIGADKAAYATLLFPIVALLISTIWENYHWTGSAMTGVALILFGNMCIIQRPKKTRPAPFGAENQGATDNPLYQKPEAQLLPVKD